MGKTKESIIKSAGSLFKGVDIFTNRVKFTLSAKALHFGENLISLLIDNIF